MIPNVRTELSVSKDGENLNTISESDLVPLPSAHAAKAPFPPGCCVWVNYAKPPELLSRQLVSEGQVQSIFMGDVFSAVKKFFYKIQLVGEEGIEIVDEANLTYAPKCPVYFFDKVEEKERIGGDSVLTGAAQKGEILSCTCYHLDDSEDMVTAYSVILLSRGSKRVVEHGIRSHQLEFYREDILVQTSESSEVAAAAPPLPPILSTSISAPPGFSSASNNQKSLFIESENSPASVLVGIR